MRLFQIYWSILHQWKQETIVSMKNMFPLVMVTKYSGFLRFTKLLVQLAQGIAGGVIEVPKSSLTSK